MTNYEKKSASTKDSGYGTKQPKMMKKKLSKSASSGKMMRTKTPRATSGSSASANTKTGVKNALKKY